MKKLTFLAAFVMLFNVTFAGGLLTNTNQSAQFLRMLSRNASLGIDAVYYNPAGLTKLEDGWHFSISNQTIFQTRDIESRFPLLNDPRYMGKVDAPVYPNAYAVYKSDRWAFSLGTGPNAGGGIADFDRGLPSFEIPISMVPAALSELAAFSQVGLNLDIPTGYSADLSLRGTSVFWGIQLGATYKINEVFSVYGGVRYLPTRNTYEGSIKNIQLKTAVGNMGATAWMNDAAVKIDDKTQEVAGLAMYANSMSQLFGGAASELLGLVNEGGGSLTIEQMRGADIISASEQTEMIIALVGLGYSTAEVGALNASQIQVIFDGASTELAGQAAAAGAIAESMPGIANGLRETGSELQDKEVDTEQTGAGITPIIGVNISPNDDWNIGIKYEHQTYMNVRNKTRVDDLGLFPDGSSMDSDVPGIISVGVGYRGIDRLEIQLSTTYFLDNMVNWGANVRDLAVWRDIDNSQIRQRMIDQNSIETGLGIQYNITDNFAISAGGLYTKAGVADSYQSDFSYFNPSFIAVGTGIEWKLTDRLTLDLAVSNVTYEDAEVNFTAPLVGTYKDIYKKTSFSLAAGLSFSIY